MIPLISLMWTRASFVLLVESVGVCFGEDTSVKMRYPSAKATIWPLGKLTSFFFGRN